MRDGMREEGDHKTIQCNGWMTEGCSGRHVSGRIVDGQIWDAPRFGNEAHENEKQRRDEKTEGPQNPTFARSGVDWKGSFQSIMEKKTIRKFIG